MPVVALSFGGNMLSYNGSPLGYWGVPQTTYTLRLLFESGVTPVFTKGSGTQISTNPNIWDLRYTGAKWDALLANQHDLLAVYAMSANSNYVTDMSGLFAGCEKLSFVTDTLKTSFVTDMSNMFQACRSLRKIPAMDTRNVTNMGGMFTACTSMTEAPALNTHKVTNFFGMLQNCSSLVSVPAYDTSKAESMGYMFHKDVALEHVPVFDSHNVREFQYMFNGCTSLKEVPLLNTSSCINVQDPGDDDENWCACYRMFKNCVSVEHGALDLYNQISTQPGGYPVKYKYEMFRNCGINTTTGADELSQIPAAWK